MNPVWRLTCVLKALPIAPASAVRHHSRNIFSLCFPMGGQTSPTAKASNSLWCLVNLWSFVNNSRHNTMLLPQPLGTTDSNASKEQGRKRVGIFASGRGLSRSDKISENPGYY